MKNPYEILVKPVITEKATRHEADTPPKYSFAVALRSNKVEIKNAVETTFNVRVRSVNTVVVKGKRKRLRTSKLGRRPNWKKAVVTLEPGQTIDLI